MKIPPLSMVDDVICVSECGFKTAMANAYIQCQTSSKKLQFGASKCKKIHVGKKCEEFKCQTMYVDSWEEVEKQNDKTGKKSIEDICLGEEAMEEKDEEKYLGDIISKDGKNLKNIQERIKKGNGIVKKILDIMDGIPFGKLYFQVAILLRNSLLVSSLLCNSEAWFNVTKPELNLIETVDTMLLRNLLKAPKSTPKEMFHLELGILPLREIIRERRLNFLHYILNQKNHSIISKVFEKQVVNSTKNDWVRTVICDLKELGLNVTFVEIKAMTKTHWKSTVKKSITEHSLKYL